jgi:FGGY-family pentulose kinase
MTEGSHNEYVIGIDVGTGSARAGVFDLRGRMVASAACPIQIFRPRPDYVEQSSRDIWRNVCRAVRECLERGDIEPRQVIGVSFDATCSLVALDAEDRSLTVSPDGDPERNVIVWMDHRATGQAEEINRTGHRVLDYVGGQLSPEQEPPKLKWIKENLPDTWERARRFFDLADYLVYEACREDARSLCTVVCKWTYLGHEGERGMWDKGFFEQIDLADLFTSNEVGNAGNASRAGERFEAPGARAGGLTPAAANELGLLAGTTVGVGIIDAHAGGIGSLGMKSGADAWAPAQIERTLALIGGTSSCHMATSPEPRFIKGVWGPYYGAMIPGMWLTEGGQSATGALLDHVISNHAYAPRLRREAQGGAIYELLNRKVAEMGAEAELTTDLHMLPDFHGNRSPRADAHARGVISGLALDSSLESLARIYLATIQAIAYGTRHIIETLNSHGYQIDRIHACGGGTKNPLWMRQHADITGCEIYVAQDSEPVLLGAAILAAVAAGRYSSIVEAMGAMSPRAEVIEPNPMNTEFHVRKYQVFKLMYEHQLVYRRLMTAAPGAGA